MDPTNSGPMSFLQSIFSRNPNGQSSPFGALANIFRPQQGPGTPGSQAAPGVMPTAPGVMPPSSSGPAANNGMPISGTGPGLWPGQAGQANPSAAVQPAAPGNQVNQPLLNMAQKLLQPQMQPAQMPAMQQAPLAPLQMPRM